MKLLTTTLLILLCATYGNSQENGIEKLRKLERNDSITEFTTDTAIVHGMFNKADTLYNVDLDKEFGSNRNDTTHIRVGSKRIIIIENGEKTSIEVPNSRNKHTFDSDKDRNYRYVYKRRFTGNWSGFEWGFNGVMDPSHSMNMQGDLRYFEINQARSWNFNINPVQYSMGFGTDKVGLVTGLGVEFNNYHFRKKNTIKVENGITVADYSYVDNPNMNVTRSSLHTIHIVAPILLEFQIPTGHWGNRFYISAGVIGGVRIHSKTKVFYKGNLKGKDRITDDFNMNPFRYGFTARIGFDNISLFANYYVTPMFEENKGDELNPFTIGLRLISF
ncbi:MAG: hypothetical protein WC951_00330 [Bacteroidales bacterium]